MDIKIKIFIANADAEALGAALQMARALDMANETTPTGNALYSNATATVHTRLKTEKPPQARTTADPVEPEPIVNSMVSELQKDPDTVQAETTPEPEKPAAPAAASSGGMSLDDLRKQFTAISKEYPAARQKVSEILVSRGATNLPTLPPDQYDSALAELEAWVKEQR